MDEDSKELVKAASQGIAEGTATAFLKTILGPAVEVVDWAVTDRVRFIRWKSQVKMLTKAEAYLGERGARPGRVSLKLLLPLLDLGSLEDPDDDEMIDRWAALLANAAAGGEGSGTVLPSFPRILSELSSGEAQILDVLYEDADPKTVPSLYRLDARSSDLGEGDPLFVQRCFNLDRLGLLRASYENVHIGESDPPVYEHTISHLEGTALALSFVLACSAPAAR